MVAQEISLGIGRAGDSSRGRRGRADALEGSVEAIEDAVELDAHLKRQCPPGHVVGRRRRGAGIGDVVRVILWLEHVEHMGPKRLRGLHHERPRGIAPAADVERRGRAMHGDARLEQRVDEACRGRKVGLIARQDVAARVSRARVAYHRHGADSPAPAVPARRCHAARQHGPGVAAAALDRVLRHPVDVEEELLTVAGGHVEHGAIGGERVVDGTVKAPGLRSDRKREVGARELTGRHEGNLGGRGAADRFGEQPDLVVEVGGGAEAAVPPRRVVAARAHGDAGLALGGEARMHRRGHEVDAERHQRIEHVIERLAEGRREHHGAGRSALVMVVDDLREPLPVEDAVHVDRLGLAREEEVAVVVVADVLLIRAGHAVERAPLAHPFAHVPRWTRAHGRRDWRARPG